MKEGQADKIRSYVYALENHLARVDGVIGDANAPKYFYHNDHLGSIKAVTNQTGQVVFQADYHAFGQRFGETGSFEELHSYTGKELDPDTGLYYFNARWYDAETGRFTTEDPIQDVLVTLLSDSYKRYIDEKNKEELNKNRFNKKMDLGYFYAYLVDPKVRAFSMIDKLDLFTYCRNNPITNTDPTGLWTASINVSGNAAFLGRLGVSVSAISIDGQGNLGIGISVNAGSGSPTLNAGGSFTFTTANSLGDLNGPGEAHAGQSFGLGPGVSVEGVIGKDNAYFGFTVGVGGYLEFAYEGHMDWSLFCQYFYVNMPWLYNEVKQYVFDQLRANWDKLTPEQQKLLLDNLGVDSINDLPYTTHSIIYVSNGSGKYLGVRFDEIYNYDTAPKSGGPSGPNAPNNPGSWGDPSSVAGLC